MIIVNLSIHLPDPLIGKLDAYATAQAKSRSSVVREAVSEYLQTRSTTVWPGDLAQWMSAAADESAADGNWPDVDAIRAEANANMRRRSDAL